MERSGERAAPGIRIRPVRPSDAPDLNELRRAPGTAETLLALPSERLSESEDFIRGLTVDDHVLVAERDVGAEGTEAVGYVWLHGIPRPRRRHVAELALAVRSDLQGRGIGRTLAEAALDLADDWLRLERVELYAFADNERAIRLYRSLGFRTEGVLRCSSIRGGLLAAEVLMARLRSERTAGAAEAEGGVAPARGLPEGARGAGTPEGKEVPREGRRREGPAPRIRPIRPEDAEALCELLRAPGTFETTLLLPDERIASREAFIRDLGRDDHVLVAEEGTGPAARVVGYAGLHGMPRPRRRHVAELALAVRPDRQGRGIGRALLEALLDLSDRWLLLERLELFVFADNERAVRLYRSLGFEVEATRRRSSVRGGRLAEDLLMARLRPSFRVRAGTLGDAAGMALVRVRTWRDAYAGLLPERVLADLDLDRSERKFQEVLAAGGPLFSRVAEEEGEIVGFALAGPRRGGTGAERDREGEVHALYVLPRCQGRGIGGALFEAAREELRRRGFRSLIVRVLEGNGCRRFYEDRGGRLAGSETEELEGCSMGLSVYRWEGLGARTRP